MRYFASCIAVVLLTACMLIPPKKAAAATITSVANGNWLSPATWDCNCIPQPTDDIVIAHDVVLNTDWAINGGSLAVNLGASLKEDAQIRNLAVSNGPVINNGVIDISRMAFLNASVTNNDSIYAQAVYNTGTIANGGSFYDVDSIYNDGVLQNLSIGDISGIYFTNANQCQNNGNISIYNFLQTGDFTNDGTINVSNDFANTGTFQNNNSIYVSVDASNTGKFYNNGPATLSIMSDFINDDSLTTLTALVNNDGLIEVWVDFSNLDSLSGTGTYCVGQYTSNAGIMTGSFDFCDKTPPQNPPYIDANTGSIDTNITWCANSLCLIVASPESLPQPQAISLYPNPAADHVRITHPPAMEIKEILFYDLAGKTSRIIPLNQTIAGDIDLSSLHAGCYIYNCISASGKAYRGMLILTK